MDIYRRDGTPYPPGDEGLFEWAFDHQDLQKIIVRRDQLPNGYVVSTIWLGLNHNYSLSQQPPLIFETMVFHPMTLSRDLYQERYSTEDDAIIGHMQTVDEFTLKAAPRLSDYNLDG